MTITDLQSITEQHQHVIARSITDLANRGIYLQSIDFEIVEITCKDDNGEHRYTTNVEFKIKIEELTT